MSDPASNALIEWTTYLEFLKIDEADTDLKEERVSLFINAASQRIETFTSRKFIAATDLEEIFDGDGEKDYYINNLPVTGTPSIHWWDGSQWVEITASDRPRVVVGDTGRIYFTQGDKFSRGDDNWRITYDYGYALDDVPGDLQTACCVLIQRAMMKSEGKEGVTIETIADHTVNIDLSRLPQDVQSVLNSYRRQSFG